MSIVDRIDWTSDLHPRAADGTFTTKALAEGGTDVDLDARESQSLSLDETECAHCFDVVPVEGSYQDPEHIRHLGQLALHWCSEGCYEAQYGL